MGINYSYVEWIQNNEIKIYCCDREKIDVLKSISAKRKLFNYKYWTVQYKNDTELARILTVLRDATFCFGFDEHGWSPASIFELLREKKMLTGTFNEISWSAPGKVITREK